MNKQKLEWKNKPRPIPFQLSTYMKKFSKKIMKVNIYHSCKVNCIFRKPQFALTKKKYFRVKNPQKFVTIAVVFPKQEPQDFRTIKRIPWNNSSETRQWRQQRFLLWSWTWASRGREQAKCCKSPWWKETHVKLSAGISVVVLRKYNSHLNNKTQGWKIVKTSLCW